MLIDEVLTPDSSRFWPREGYTVGVSQKSFDKQFVRDYLLSLKWDQKPPAPRLPEDVVNKTSKKYLEVLTCSRRSVFLLDRASCTGIISVHCIVRKEPSWMIQRSDPAALQETR